MNKIFLLWSLTVFILNMETGLCTIKCKNIDKCYCSSNANKYKLKCPRNIENVKNGFIIQATDDLIKNSINIECLPKEKKKEKLPVVNIENATELSIQYYPLPKKNLKQIIEKFSIKKLTALRFSQSKQSGFLISKEYFKLKYLRNLDLAKNQFNNSLVGIFKKSKKFKYLNFWSNQLQNLNNLSFMGLVNLRHLKLSKNQLNSIEEDAFQHLKNLRTIDLSNLNLTLVPTDIFLGANNIEIVILSGNRLKVLPDDIFMDLDHLKELHLNRNNLETLETPFKKLKKLKLLDLGYNLLRRLEENIFKDLTSLEVLYLNQNQITYIDSSAFVYNKNLKEVYVANNSYSSTIGSYELFRASTKLEVLDFSHNKLTALDSVVTANVKFHLKHLDFSYNHLTSFKISDFELTNTTINLENNDIRKVDFQHVLELTSGNNNNTEPTTTKILLSKNPIVCDCINYDLLRFLKGDYDSKIYDIFKIQIENVTCTQPENVHNILFEELLLIDITCPLKQIPLNLSCPNNCQCLARPYDKSYIVNCSGKGLSTYPPLEFTPSSKLNQVELHLEFNNFTSGPSSVEIEKYYSNVTRLYLANNCIKNITSIPAKLQLLQLHNNLLERLDDKFLEYLNASSLSNLTLDGNPWICECNKIENLAQYLRNHAKKVVAASSILCGNTKKAIIDLNKNDLCKEWQLITLVIIIMTVLMLCAATAAFYRNKNMVILKAALFVVGNRRRN